jgi:nitrite reductase/ring-hydroxylating ferredoxin subunit
VAGRLEGSVEARGTISAVPRRTQESMIAALTELGVHFRQVEVVTEGTYLPEDVDWNYKDVPHLNQVHGWATNVNGVTDEHAEASLNLQRVLGLRLPLVLSHYETGPYRHTYFFTLLVYSVVCETRIERTDDGTTRVTTNYGVGSSRPWMLAFPLISWVLRRNYRQLMREDVPMRERREQLRSWGYAFKGDGRPRTFPDSLKVERDNVVLTHQPESEEVAQLELGTFVEGERTLWGRDDHLGLRIERHAEELDVYSRLCPHEGASLDDAERRDDCLRCPWHGRRLEPLARLLVRDGQEVDTTHHHLRVQDGVLRIRVRAASLSNSTP